MDERLTFACVIWVLTERNGRCRGERRGEIDQKRDGGEGHEGEGMEKRRGGGTCSEPYLL